MWLVKKCLVNFGLCKTFVNVQLVIAILSIKLYTIIDEGQNVKTKPKTEDQIMKQYLLKAKYQDKTTGRIKSDYLIAKTQKPFLDIYNYSDVINYCKETIKDTQPNEEIIIYETIQEA